MGTSQKSNRPNVVYVFGDQWRAQATGYAGDPNVQTPHLDQLASQSLNLVNAVAGQPVCSPSRACLLTGQHALTHGVFVNDVPLRDRAVSLAQAFDAGGYDTAYIGKWHVGGRGRSNYIRPEHRLGFDYWKVLECTHAYNRSLYYAGDDEEVRQWEGYDAIAQTRDAQRYIRNHEGADPFFLVLSWGPPHDPYETAPAEFNQLYDPAALRLRPNVSAELETDARQWLAGYYAHCSALDACTSDLLQTLEEEGIAENTLFVFTSDHGDMLGSQGLERKQKPWDESIRVPFLLRWPAHFGHQGREVDALIDTVDIMPTLLDLCGLDIPTTVEGKSFAHCLKGGPDPSSGAALISCYHPFSEWHAGNGGREFRGLRTKTHTYVRSLEGPWLLYDNEHDPYQLENQINRPEVAAIQADLDEELQARLSAMGDEFLPGTLYLEKWGYEVDVEGAVPYTD